MREHNYVSNHAGETVVGVGDTPERAERAYEHLADRLDRRRGSKFETIDSIEFGDDGALITDPSP